MAKKARFPFLFIETYFILSFSTSCPDTKHLLLSPFSLTKVPTTLQMSTISAPIDRDCKSFITQLCIYFIATLQPKVAIYERSITDIKEYRSSSSSSDSAAAPVEELSVADQDSVWELQSLIAKRIMYVFTQYHQTCRRTTSMALKNERELYFFAVVLGFFLFPSSLLTFIFLSSLSNNLLCFQQPTTHHHPVINRFRIRLVK